jgi:hypothetical protein
MRTNIVLSRKLLEEAALYTKAKSKTALVEEALLMFVRIKAEERKSQGYEQKIRLLEARLCTLKPARQSVRELVRSDRERATLLSA